MAPTEQPAAVDFAGTALNVGDRVAFILIFSNQPGLFGGRIALIGKDQVCIDSGTLHVVRGSSQKSTGKPERIRYGTIIRRPDTEADA